MILIKLKLLFYFYFKKPEAVKNIFKGGSQPCLNNNPTTSTTSIIIIIGAVLILFNYKLYFLKLYMILYVNNTINVSSKYVIYIFCLFSDPPINNICCTNYVTSM